MILFYTTTVLNINYEEMLKYGEPYYNVEGTLFLKGSDDVKKTDSDPFVVLIKHPLYHYIFHYIPIEFPLGTIWKGVDVQGDFGKKGEQMVVRYHKEVPNLAIFKIKLGEKTINTTWRVNAHQHFIERYNMIIKEIPLKSDIKSNILENYCVRTLCLNRNLCIDVENIIFLFLGYKKHLRKMK